MAEVKIDELRERLDQTTAELKRVQKQLQKPSTISFADRRDLTNRAGKLVEELGGHRASLEGKADGDEDAAALATEIEAALDRAGVVLGKAGGGGKKSAPGAARGGGSGMTARGATGASQTRAPNRSGGE